MSQRTHLAAVALLVAGFVPTARSADDRPHLIGGEVRPHWTANDAGFWFRADRPEGGHEFVFVDARAGTRRPLFDHTQLAATLSDASGAKVSVDNLSPDDLHLADDLGSLTIKVGNARWACRLADYTWTRLTDEPPAPGHPSATPGPERRGRGGRSDSARSPDGRGTVRVEGGNLFLRTESGTDTRLTTDGRPGLGYDLPAWSPDSTRLVAFRVTPGAVGEVFRVESSPKGGGRAVLHRNEYALPGDKFPSYEPVLLDPWAGRVVPSTAPAVDFGRPDVRWSADGKTLTYTKVDRGHQRFRLIAVDAGTGDSRNVIDETADTFIWTAHNELVGVPKVTRLTDTNEIVFASEKSGWRHLYLIDAATGEEKNPITAGEWVVRGIDFIDEGKRQVWFRAGGYYPDQDPYYVHHFRVNFDGTGLTPLTAGNGTHTVRYSPGREFLVDTYSRADRPPVHELRRTGDGTLVCALGSASVVGHAPPAPAPFSAKGRDGTTDVWGLIHKPADFDPARTYPVIEAIYAGPHGAHVPKAFATSPRYSHLTDLGFVVVQIDGMGTAQRSKAFHDVCWHDLKDAGFPDRIAWHKAAAAKFPWYDVTRVGIFGTSAGGQNAAGAVLFHGDFYKAASAACGCHDNRMDKASWNEQWMGYPVGPHYAASSNIENAHRLRGHLQLIVGELDTNVPPESTYRFCDALIKAGKDFEFIMIPGMGHSDGGAYGRRKQQDFFARHLLGTTPPDRNAAPTPTTRSR